MGLRVVSIVSNEYTTKPGAVQLPCIAELEKVPHVAGIEELRNGPKHVYVISCVHGVEVASDSVTLAGMNCAATNAISATRALMAMDEVSSKSTRGEIDRRSRAIMAPTAITPNAPRAAGITAAIQANGCCTTVIGIRASPTPS